jgi:hypothetical protein
MYHSCGCSTWGGRWNGEAQAGKHCSGGTRRRGKGNRVMLHGLPNRKMILHFSTELGVGSKGAEKHLFVCTIELAVQEGKEHLGM